MLVIKRGEMSLLDGIEGITYSIIDIEGGMRLKRRLYSIGLYPGAKVSIVNKAPLGGPVLVKNIETNVQLALGRGVLSKIIVTPLS